jgi:hypothetical protein
LLVRGGVGDARAMILHGLVELWHEHEAISTHSQSALPSNQ